MNTKLKLAGMLEDEGLHGIDALSLSDYLVDKLGQDKIKRGLEADGFGVFMTLKLWYYSARWTWSRK